MAVRLHQSGRVAEAERLYRQILEFDPRHCDALHMLGVLAMQAGRHEAAVQLIRQAIAFNNRVPAFHNNLGNAFSGWGKPQEALAAYQSALTCAPDHAGAHYNLAVTLQPLGRTEEASLSYRRTVALQPGHAEAEHNLGNMKARAGDMDGAVWHYRRALALRPRNPEALCNLGNALILQGRNDEAASFFQQALSLQPGHGGSLCGLGIIKLRLARIEETIFFCRRAIVADPGFANSYVTLGTALGETDKREETMQVCRRATLLDPDSAEARLTLAVNSQSRFEEALDELEQWHASHPGRLGAAIGTCQPFHLAYRSGDVTAPLLRYGALASRAAATAWQVPAWQKRAAGKIRLGVVSGHVRTHPVWNMLLKGVIGHLDRDRFEIFLYHTGETFDAETDWARGKVERFIQGPMSVKGWLARLAEDRPDVLYYPEVGMDPVTGALAARRLAPVQAAGWGHPVTTGLPTIDLYFSGELLEGEGADAHYREKLIRLPGTGVFTSWAPESSASFSGAGGGVTKFALCQQPFKFDPAHDGLLTRIARQAGPCEFWVARSKTHPWHSDKLLARLAASFRGEGLDPDLYLKPFPWMGRQGFSGFLDTMDVLLDCPSFSGYTTGWQALHRGLPIVTLEGEFLRQRLAAGLLRQIGRIDGLCSTEEAYVDAALSRPRRIPKEAAMLMDGNKAAIDAFAESLISALA